MRVAYSLSKVLWLKLSEEALKESEELYRILTEQVTDGVVLTQNSRFCYVNPASCKMFNISSADNMINRPVDSPAFGDVHEIIRMYSDADIGIADKVEKVHRLSRPGKNLWIQACHSPITFKGLPALLSNFKDVTEIKEQQIAAQSMTDQLHDENRVLRASLKERYRFGNILGRSPNPAMSRRRVVFPKPKGPNRVTNSPWAISRSKSLSTASWPSKDFASPRIVSTDLVSCAP